MGLAEVSFTEIWLYIWMLLSPRVPDSYIFLDEIKVIQVRMPDLTSASSAIDEEWARQQQWQQILAVVRNSSLGVTALAAVVLIWILLRNLWLTNRRINAGCSEMPFPFGIILLWRMRGANN